MFFSTLDSNREPICNANVEIFWKNLILLFFKYTCSLVLHFFQEKNHVIRKYALSDSCVWRHFGQAICEEKRIEHNSILFSVVGGTYSIVGTQYDYVQDTTWFLEHNSIMWRHPIELIQIFGSSNGTLSNCVLRKILRCLYNWIACWGFETLRRKKIFHSVKEQCFRIWKRFLDGD